VGATPAARLGVTEVQSCALPRCHFYGAQVTAGGESYVYNVYREISDLYLVEGLR
jgi:hypothetical protein